MLGPVIENGAAVEKHHVGHAARLGRGRVVGEAYAVKQAQKIELAGLHLLENIRRREIIHPDNDFAA